LDSGSPLLLCTYAGVSAGPWLLGIAYERFLHGLNSNDEYPYIRWFDPHTIFASASPGKVCFAFIPLSISIDD